MTLTEYVQDLAGRRTRYGEHDCLLAVADWARELTGVDVGALYRGTYSTGDGWREIVAVAGGMADLVDSICAVIGLRRVVQAMPGDVGVLDLPEVGHIGAICTGVRWVMLTERGLAALQVTSARVVTAWGKR